MMNKRFLCALLVMGAGWSFGELVKKEDFSYPDGTRLEQIPSWSDEEGLSGRAVIAQGVLQFTDLKGKFYCTLDETYSLVEGAPADHVVPELWFRVRAKVEGGEKSSVRFGVTSSEYAQRFDTYASVQITMPANSPQITLLRAYCLAKHTTASGPLPSYAGGFADIYGRLSSDSSGEKLQVEFWFNPQDPSRLGKADVAHVMEYQESKVIDRLTLNGWSLAVAELDCFYLGTLLTDVMP